RSNYINSILAEHLSYVTPEKRMRNIFDVLEAMAQQEEAFRIQKQQSESMFSLLSSLKYKYRPTIRYQIELYPTQQNGTIGEFKVIFRTQSEDFAEMMKTFFITWAKHEQKFISNIFAKSPVKYSAGEGKLIRQIKVPSGKSLNEKELAMILSNYIQMFDKALKEYIESIPDTQYAEKYIDKMYSSFIKNSIALI
ncbi:MAG: hypothetical protein IKB60_02300, partial [Clostridia bacterium]|nr:hypothetical protein [Clostridia bacterium]